MVRSPGSGACTASSPARSQLSSALRLHSSSASTTGSAASPSSEKLPRAPAQQQHEHGGVQRVAAHHVPHLVAQHEAQLVVGEVAHQLECTITKGLSIPSAAAL